MSFANGILRRSHLHPNDPKNYLKIPNKIAAKRIATAVIRKYRLGESLNIALSDLAKNGDLKPVLSCYRKMMVQRDVGISDLKNKTEEVHRDSFYFTLLQNHCLKPTLEFNVVKVFRSSTIPRPMSNVQYLQLNRKPGRIDLALQLPKYIVITEWKFL
jgi:hypothetical protein